MAIYYDHFHIHPQLIISIISYTYVLNCKLHDISTSCALGSGMQGSERSHRVCATTVSPLSNSFMQCGIFIYGDSSSHLPTIKKRKTITIQFAVSTLKESLTLITSLNALNMYNFCVSEWSRGPQAHERKWPSRHWSLLETSGTVNCGSRTHTRYTALLPFSTLNTSSTQISLVSTLTVSFFLLADKTTNPYTVQPSYTFCAPWIGCRSRSGHLVFNTEHRKCSRISSAAEDGYDELDAEESLVQRAVSEEELVEMMQFAQVSIL